LAIEICDNHVSSRFGQGKRRTAAYAARSTSDKRHASFDCLQKGPPLKSFLSGVMTVPTVSGSDTKATAENQRIMSTDLYGLSIA
jgi:hypothetical protein